MTPKPIRWRQFRHHREIYLFILPTLLLIALFQYYPAASGVFHSFFRWNGADISEPVGVENNRDLISDSSFWQSFRVAFILGLWNVLKMIPALAVAVCIHRCRSARMRFIYRAAFVVPMVIPGLVIALVWRSFFFEATSGYLNQFLDSTGLLNLLIRCDAWFSWGGIFAAGRSPAWLGDPRLILVACVVWGFPWVGSFAVLTHLAKLQNISREIYDAAAIDGVSWWSKFTRIELPSLAGSIYLLLVFLVIDTIKDASFILALAGFEGGPGGAVTVPALFMIRKAFVEQQMGYACAVGMVLTVIVMALQKISTAIVEWDTFSLPRRAMNATIAIAAGTLITWTISPWLTGFVVVATASICILASSSIPTLSLPDPLLRLLKHGFILLILALAFLPLYLMLVVSLKDNTQFYSAPTTLSGPFHWENWSSAWHSVLPSVANSIFISISTTAIASSVALGAAYFFSRLRMPLSSLLWNLILILMMMPAIANLVPLFRLLRDLNLLNTLTALVLVGASGGQVFAIFVLRNFILDIPQDLFEAAEIDGASHFQQLRVIVAPLVAPVLGTVGVMQFISTWNDFVLPLIIMRDESRLPVMVHLLRMAGEYVKYWGPMMAGYTLASLPVIALFMLSMKLFVRGMTEGAVKE